MIFQVLIYLFFRQQLPIIVRCHAVEEITVGHAGFVVLLLVRKNFKHFLRAGEEANLIFVLSTNEIGSRWLTLILSVLVSAYVHC